MPRYYFYQADLYRPDGDPSGVDRLLGSNHGVYAVEDESAPDLIFDQIVKGLTDDANTQFDANARTAGLAPEPSGMYYVMRQFYRVD
jgi:hypothetical protein